MIDPPSIATAKFIIKNGTLVPRLFSEAKRKYLMPLKILSNILNEISGPFLGAYQGQVYPQHYVPEVGFEFSTTSFLF